MKKTLITSILMAVMVIGLNTNVYASESIDLKDSYQTIMQYANDIGVSIDMSMDAYEEIFAGENIEDYEAKYYEVLDESSARSGSDGKYYYNTGGSCPSQVNYNKYNLLSVVQPGDIIYEANGGFGITGHIAIVESISTGSNGTRYIRIVEAIDVGVVRSVLDDTRVDDKAVTIYRVKNATSSQKNSAINFCISQLGDSYSLDLQKDTSSSETDWYCSELVWAAYKNQGIDLETTDSLPGITPSEIKNSSKVNKISFSAK